MNKKIWLVSSVLILFAINFIMADNSTISGDKASQIVIDYLDKLLNENITLNSYVDIGFVYEINITYQQKTLSVYVSKDGKYLMPTIIDMSQNMTIPGPECTTNSDCKLGYYCNENSCMQNRSIIKSDKPKVELFVFTKCPYGAQAERGLLPVVSLLKNKIDFKIEYLNYFIHGDEEETETYRQLCIREQYPDKFLSYIKCYLQSGDGKTCSRFGYSLKKLNSCMNKTALDYFSEDSKIDDLYGINGSPTLVINGVETDSMRSPNEYLKTICKFFNNPPKECKRVLSDINPKAGF